MAVSGLSVMQDLSIVLDVGHCWQVLSLCLGGVFGQVDYAWKMEPGGTLNPSSWYVESSI